MSNLYTRLFPEPKWQDDSIIWTNNVFWVHDWTWEWWDTEKKKEFRRIYTSVLFHLKSDRFLHPHMEHALKYITPEGKRWVAIRNEWYKTVAYNTAWIAVNK